MSQAKDILAFYMDKLYSPINLSPNLESSRPFYELLKRSPCWLVVLAGEGGGSSSELDLNTSLAKLKN